MTALRHVDLASAEAPLRPSREDTFVIGHDGEAIVGTWWERADTTNVPPDADWWRRWRSARARAITLLGIGPEELGETLDVAVVVVHDGTPGSNLDACLRSLRSAAVTPAEVVVVSTTPATAADRASCDAWGCRMLEAPATTVAEARSRGVAATTAPLIAFTASTALLAERWLDGLQEGFRDPLVAACSGFVGPAALDGVGARRVERARVVHFPRRPDRRRFDPLLATPSTVALEAGRAWNLVVRRDDLMRAGGFDPRLSARTVAGAFDDVALLQRLMALGRRVDYDSQRQVWCHWPSGGVSSAHFIGAFAMGRARWRLRRICRPAPIAAADAHETQRPRAAFMATRVASEPPRISVAISTFQRREALRTVLSRFATQTLPADRFDVVVVVDGSTDGSAEMARGLTLPFGLRVVEQRNAGLAVGRNRGAQEATGDVIVFWDDDIHPDPDCLAAHADHHARASQTSWLMGEFPPVVGSGWIDQWVEAVWHDHFRRKARADHRWSLVDMVDGNSSVRASTFAELGGFDPAFTGGRRQDWEMGVRLLAAGIPMAASRTASGSHHCNVSYATMLSNAFAEGRYDAVLARRQPTAAHQLPIARLDRSLAARRTRRVISALGERRSSSVARRLEAAGQRAAWRSFTHHARWASYAEGWISEAGTIGAPNPEEHLLTSVGRALRPGVDLCGVRVRLGSAPGDAVEAILQPPGDQWDAEEAVNRLAETLMTVGVLEEAE